MKKFTKFINFLAGLSNVVYVLAIFSSALLIITFWFHILSPGDGPFDVVHQFSVPLSIPSQITLQSGEILQDTIQAHSISLPVVFHRNWGMIVIYFVFLILMLSTVIYFIFQFKKLFEGLKKSLKEETFFQQALTKHIKRIGYTILFFVLLDFLNKAFFFLYVDEIKTMGETLHTYFSVNSGFFGNILFGLIILLIAEIYKEGSKLKQENQLTI